MCNVKLSLFLILFFAATNVAAYGSSSSSKKACLAPRFSDFNPPHLSAVAPGAAFSFSASQSTEPSSIEVSVKKQAVAVDVAPAGGGYKVSGKLPPALKGTYARVGIEAKGTNKCQGSDGWLLKISE